MSIDRERSVVRLVAISCLGLLAACQGVDHVMQTHYRLETAFELVEQDQHSEAITLLDATLADVEPMRDEFVLQRFYACYLMTQAQILEAQRERPEDDPNAFRSRRIDPRVMTAMMFVGNARDVADAAAAAARVAPDGQRLLPGRLDGIAVQDARSHLELLVVGFYGGLRFNDRMRIALEGLEEFGNLTSFDSCIETLDRLQVIEGVQPWILVAVYRSVRDADPRKAYKFAIAALHHEQSRIDPLTQAELVDWINEGSEYVFLCGECDQVVVPDRPACHNCGASYLEAYGVEREADQSP